MPKCWTMTPNEYIQPSFCDINHFLTPRLPPCSPILWSWKFQKKLEKSLPNFQKRATQTRERRVRQWSRAQKTRETIPLGVLVKPRKASWTDFWDIWPELMKNRLKISRVEKWIFHWKYLLWAAYLKNVHQMPPWAEPRPPMESSHLHFKLLIAS